MTHTRKNVLTIFFAVIMAVSAIFFVAQLNTGHNTYAEPNSNDFAAKYTIEFTQMGPKRFYIANATPLTKGDSLTFTFTVKAVNKYAQDSWKYRFAKICNSDTIGNAWDGNTSGANWYVDGRWANYNNEKLLPLYAGSECKLVLTPTDETGDTYNFVWTVNGTQKSAGSVSYSEYLGMLLQGWKCELLLTDVTASSETTDYGVYAYDPDDEVLTTENVSREDWHTVTCTHGLTNVPEVPATCTTAGQAAYSKCDICGISTIKYGEGGEIAATGHNYQAVAAVPVSCETNGNIAYYTCSNCDKLFTYDGEEYTEVEAEDVIIVATGHNFVDGVCTICHKDFVTKYTIEFTQMGPKRFYIANATPLTKGESLTFTFTVKAVNKYAQDSWKYRFAKICNSDTIGNAWDGNTSGANWYVDGRWANYNNEKLLPLYAGSECKLVLTPTDETGDTYNYVWTVNGTQKSAGSVSYSEYLGMLLQGWKCELLLTNVTASSETTDYGVYAYDPDDEVLTTENVSRENWHTVTCTHGLTNVPEVPATCTTAGQAAYSKCDICGISTIKYGEGSVIAASGHDYKAVAAVPVSCETNGNIAYYTCSNCDKLFTYDGEEYTEVEAEDVIIVATGHNFVDGVCTICHKDFVTKYTIEFTQMGPKRFYIANATPLTKGDILTFTFTVKAVNKYAQDSWKYRFAKICNSDTIGNAWDGNTSGANWYVDGRWANYNNEKLLPLYAGSECKLVLTPTDETGDTYNYVWTVNGTQKSAGSVSYSEYLGMLLQGWKCELLLTNVTASSETTDYGVYAYDPDDEVLMTENVSRENWHTEISSCKHDWVTVPAQAATCVATGWSTYEKCEIEGCEFSTLKYNILPVDPNAHTLEGTCFDGTAVCKDCGETVEVPHEFVNGRCVNCGTFLMETVKNYGIEIINESQQGTAVHVSNKTELKKGDTMIFEFTVSAVEKYSQEDWKYRFAMICGSNETNIYWDGNTGKGVCWSNWYVSGKWANYANCPTLPLDVSECKLVFTPEDESGNTYCCDWYVNGTNLSRSTGLTYQKYMGFVLQGWRFELTLDNAICYGKTTDYGVFVYEHEDYTVVTTDKGYTDYYAVEVTVNGGHGSADYNVCYKADENALVRFIPERGYKIKSIMLNGEDITDEVTFDHAFNIFDYEATMQNDLIFAVEFEEDDDITLTVYDFYDISGKALFEVDATERIYAIGNMPATENVGLKFYFDLGSQFGIAANSWRQFGFMQEAGNPLWTPNGFEVTFYTNTLRLWIRGGNPIYYLDKYLDFTAGQTLLVEIGTFNVSETEARVYLIVDGVMYFYEKYEKTNYSISTGVGGLYVDYQTDVDGGIRLRTLYDYYDLTLAEDYEGVSVKSGKYVISGKEVVLTAENGYVITSVTANGTPVGFTGEHGVYRFTLNDISEAQTVTLGVAYSEKTVTVNAVEGQVAVTAPEKVAERSDCTLTITALTGYAVESVSVNGTDVTSSLVYTDAGATLTIENVTEDLVITVVAIEKNFTVTATGDEGCEVTASATTIASNGTVKFTVTLKEGYRLNNMKINGRTVYPEADGTFTVNNVKEDITLTVVTEKINGDSEVVASSDSEGCIGSIEAAGLLIALLSLTAAKTLLRKKEN